VVLLVEDDEALRRMLAEALALEGYRVVAVPDGERALRRARSRRADLLVADVLLPGMDGAELARVLGARQPDLRVLYISGCPGAFLEERGLLPVGAPFLRKPFALEALAAAAAATLAAAPRVRRAAREPGPLR
jgi:DNA-binding response OmpR family regulator